MKRILILPIVIVLIQSCGPSAAEQQQAQQLRDDSIRLATEQRMQAKHDLEMQIMSLTTEIANMKDELVKGNAELEVAIDRLARIKEWQFGRTPDERESQIREQSTVIQNLEAAIINYKQAMADKEGNLIVLQNELNKY